MPINSKWAGWADRLSDPALPAQAGMEFARHGDEGQRWNLTGNPGLPVDVLTALVNDPDEVVATATLSNYELPSELLSRLRERFGHKRAVADMIAHHPNAPIATKRRLRLDGTTGAALERFFVDVKATEDEKHSLAAVGEENPGITLGRAWAVVRPSRRGEPGRPIQKV